MKTTNKILEIVYIGDKKFEAAFIGFFNITAWEKVKIIKTSYNDRTQLNCVYDEKESIKIGKKFPTLDAFISVVADMIGFEIAERSQCSDNVTLVNEEGFQLSAMLSEA